MTTATITPTRKLPLIERLDRWLHEDEANRIIMDVEQIDPAELRTTDGHLQFLIWQAEHGIARRHRLIAALHDVLAARPGGQ
jgi:hypothetical protein